MKLSGRLDRPEDGKISKTANDSFYKTSLEEDLIRLGINELVITGTATDFAWTQL